MSEVLTEMDSRPLVHHSRFNSASNLTNAKTTPYHIYSYRLFLLMVALSLLVGVCLPYLIFSPDHPDSCYIVRSPRKIHAEQLRAEESIVNATGGIDVPAIDAVESSPESGRKRTPAIFYANQTAIMIALLALLLATKFAYAWRHMRPTVKLHSAEGNVKNNQKHSGGKSVRDASASSSSPHEPPMYFRSHWWEIFRMLFAYLFYLASYFLCNALKSILNDSSCSDHGNSVSGHYLFHCFALWTIGYFHLTQKNLHTESIVHRRFWKHLLLHRDLKKLDYVFLILFPTYAFVVISILSDTYFYGFHSLRQIIYGFTLAVVVFLACTGILEAVEDRLSVRGLRAVKPSKENHAISHAYSPMIAGLLHEWFHSDEMAGRFYVFPLAALFTFQLFSWTILALSPRPGFFGWADVIAVLIGSALLTWIWKFKLQLPKRANR